MKNLKSIRQETQTEGLKDACWKDYEAIGTKPGKNGKPVPNCVPKEGHAEDAQTAHQAAHAALKKGDIDTYHQEMDKKFAAHLAASDEASKKPVKTFEDTDEQKNLKITKHEKAAVEAEKRGDTNAQKYHLDRVKSLQSESVVTEAKKVEEDKPLKHLVTVTVTDPHHGMSSKRKEKIMKRVKVSAANPREAVKKAEAHYKKHGFKVHDSLHHSIVNESLDTDEFIDSYDPTNSHKDTEGNVSENSTEGETQAPEDKEAVEKIKLLIRLGMLEMSDLPIAARVIRRIELDQPVTATQERAVLAKLMRKFVEFVTQDDFIFRKVRQSVVSANKNTE